MSGNNDSGGGTFLWMVDLITNAVNNRRVIKYNKQSRGLEKYKDITLDLLLPIESYQDNIIISGGDVQERLNLSERIISNAFNQRRPMIILHLANYALENMVINNRFGTIVNNNNKHFDAFTSFELQEICQVVLDTCKAKYDIKPPARYILQVVYELLACRNRRPYFSNFANCTFYKLSDRINDRLTQGYIMQDTANNLNSLLLMGQAECAKIDTFFYDMKSQIDHISTNNANNTGGKSILSAIKKDQILCIDLRSSANAMLMELIVNSLTIAMNRGYEFSLFIDDVAIVNNELLKNALCQKSNHNNIICSKDLYALLSGKDDVFSTLVGEAEKTILFSHASNISCDKWSKYFGEYDKIDVSHNSNSGWNKSSKWGYNSNHGKTMSDKREYKIKPEQINRLSQNEIFIYDNANGSLIQTSIA